MVPAESAASGVGPGAAIGVTATTDEPLFAACPGHRRRPGHPRLLSRSDAQGTCGAAFQAAGLVLPPTVQQVEAETPGEETKPSANHQAAEA